MPKKGKQALAVIVGANITAKRKLKDLNQAQFAELVGIGPDSLSRIERGLTAPRFQTLEKMAHILECPVAEFFLTDKDNSLQFISTCQENSPEIAKNEIVFMAERIIQIAKSCM